MTENNLLHGHVIIASEWFKSNGTLYNYCLQFGVVENREEFHDNMKEMLKDILYSVDIQDDLCRYYFMRGDSDFVIDVFNTFVDKHKIRDTLLHINHLDLRQSYDYFHSKLLRVSSTRVFDKNVKYLTVVDRRIVTDEHIIKAGFEIIDNVKVNVSSPKTNKFCVQIDSHTVHVYHEFKSDVFVFKCKNAIKLEYDLEIVKYDGIVPFKMKQQMKMES